MTQGGEGGRILENMVKNASIICLYVYAQGGVLENMVKTLALYVYAHIKRL